MKHLFAGKPVLPVFVMLLLLTWSCKKSTTTNPNPPPSTKDHGAGWSGTDDPSKVPQAVNVAALAGGSAALPSSVDLTPFAPPVGDQGQTATCVAWASAYYGKTMSEAIAFNYDQSKLSSQSYEFSPRAMFLSIPDNLKGTDCQSGTQITAALDIMVSDGVATLATAPWNPNIANCSQSQYQSSWNTDAANHKIVYYRTIPSTVDGIKEQLAANNPVLMGIRESDEFKNYTGGVISNSTFTGPIGLHAQCIVGYDDSKNAFRVINSWGTSWGDNGLYWVNYNTLVNDLISGGNVYYMASSSSNNNVTPPTTTTTTGSVDIAPWVFSDVSTATTTGDQTSRTIYLNIYNIGTDPANASSNWGLYYIYYNAFNANDYGIIFHDQFNTSIATNSYSCPTNNACTFNYNIPSGSNFAEIAFPGTTEIYRNYNVPNITGYYYVVLIADPQKVLSDVNQQNNIFYTTGQLPAYVQNGYTSSYDPNSGAIKDGPKNDLQVNERNLRFSRFNSSVGVHNRNAYTPEEILSFVKAKYESGEIKKKINAMKADKKARLPQLH